MPDQVSDLGEYLREQREQARLSVRQLAQAAGVSNPYLSQIERGLRKPSADVLQQIAKGLRISAEALYVRAGILDEAVGIDVEVAIRTDPLLTERQRRVLLEIYASFMAENGRAAQAADTSDQAGAGDTDDVTPTAGARPAAPRKRVAKRAAKKAPALVAEPVTEPVAEPVAEPAGAKNGRPDDKASTTTRKTPRRAARKAAVSTGRQARRKE
jgi:transcriptional regulator with XRE-family HTH domain